MTRRSTPQAKLDEAAFPVRLRIHVPETGFGGLITDLQGWLEKNAPEGFAWHPGGRLGMRDCNYIYFRHPSFAVAFLAAFPRLEIADGTTRPGYSSPSLLHLRKPADV